MERVANILEADPSARLGVVLSACRGITDALLNLVTAAEKQDEQIADNIEAIRARHDTIATTLLNKELRAEYLAELDADLKNVAGILQAIRLIRSASQTVRDLVAGYGEIWSTRLFFRYLRQRGK